MSQTFVIVAVCVYLAGLLFIGAVRLHQDPERHRTSWSRGRRLGLGLCTFTLFATWFGGGTLIGGGGELPTPAA